MSELVLRYARLVYADGSIVDGGLRAPDRTVVEVFANEPGVVPACAEVIDAGGKNGA